MINQYALKGNQFVISQYDKLPPFSSFLPGIAGVMGIPLWAFYCNRGQCVNSFGVHHKGNAIMEFNPANTAYENTALKGFRTFMRIDGEYIEPFSPLTDALRDMYISPNALTLREENARAGYDISVTYFLLPNAPLGALVRRVCVKNTHASVKRFELLDGLPKIIPYGVQLGAFKEMSNLMKSWTHLTNIENNAPVYAMRASSDDSVEVKRIQGGYFYLAVSGGETLRVIYDPDAVFGYESSLQRAREFEAGGLERVLKREQCFSNKIACAFTPAEAPLAPGESLSFDSITGFSASEALINGMIPEFTQAGYALKKEAEARALADDYTNDVDTVSGNPVFDQYVRQCYLDNFLRGGYPYVLGGGARKHVMHLFSRKHGDPERDYNFFTTAGEYYSQGNGNFRDVCQNRRNDVMINPCVGDFNVHTFLSLIQMDGYNPLEIRPSTFVIGDAEREKAIEVIERRVPEARQAAEDMIASPFTPGKLLGDIAARGLKVEGGEREFISELTALAQQRVEAGFGEGYWSDHFSYCLDLVEDYLSVFPDKRAELFFGREDYRYYDSVAVVRPRRDTYVLTEHGVRQYGAVYHDPEKAAREGFDPSATNWQKDARGQYVKTNLFGKLFSLAINKYALIDPAGMGVEMDGGKPGWCDAMNGLPGLMGSGMPETLELRRLLSAMLDACPNEGDISLPEEVAGFALKLYQIEECDAFARWNRAAELREEYRQSVRLCASGERARLPYNQIADMLKRFLERVDAGVSSALALGGGVMPTYFTYEAIDWSPITNEAGESVISPYGLPAVVVNKFEQRALPVFLEGPARMLAAARESERADMALMASKLKSSKLYDEKLRMFRTSEPLEGLSMDIGRIMAFTPGWLERESVFLHMEYKYFLGLLKCGLYDEFFECVKHAFIPFLEPSVYGRSVLENSSFIASSANPDPATHGRGYVARLSGSTTEVISIWLKMFLGGGYSVEQGELVLRFAPALPEWLFNSEGEASFMLFSHARVVYNNNARKPTYGEGGARAREIICHYAGGGTARVRGDSLRGEHARALRDGRVERVDVKLE